MTIGRNSRKGSARSSIRAPKFLDKSSGFYGRLDEPGTSAEGEGTREYQAEERGDREGDFSRTSPASVPGSGVDEREECEGSDFTEGATEDDSETLLRRKPSRRSSRWRRSSRRRQKEARGEEVEEEAAQGEAQSPGCDAHILVKMEVEMEGGEGESKKTEPGVVHFQVREEADDQVLIRDKKRGREEEEEEEERRMKREQEEGMKVVKRKNYRKALDRAFRRGWEAFITNLYSITLTPATSSSQSASSPSSKKKTQHTAVLAEFH